MTTTSTRVVRLLGGLLGLALVIGGAWSLLGLMARNSFDARATYSGVKSLVVGTPGEVRLTARPAGSALLVRAHVTRAFREPKRQALRTGAGGLELRDSCSGLFSDNCTVDYDIAVPRGTSVRVESGDGDVVATDVVAGRALRLASGTGDVSASGVRASSLELSSGAGDVHGVSIRATRISASSGAGDVSLDVARPARLLTAQAGAGSVLLRVPDVTYAFDAAAGGGRVLADGVRNDTNSPRVLRAQSGGGSVIVDVR